MMNLKRSRVVQPLFNSENLMELGTLLGCFVLLRSQNSPGLCTLSSHHHSVSEISHPIWQPIQGKPPVAHLFFCFLETDVLPIHQGCTSKSCSVINSSVTLESTQEYRHIFSLFSVFNTFTKLTKFYALGLFPDKNAWEALYAFLINIQFVSTIRKKHLQCGPRI